MFKLYEIVKDGFKKAGITNDLENGVEVPEKIL